MVVNGNKIRQVLGKNIKAFREHRNWSQADLAAYSEISIPFLSEIERGNKWPFPDTLAKIAKALNIKIHELFWEKTKTSDENDFADMVVKEVLIAQKKATDNVCKKYLG